MRKLFLFIAALTLSVGMWAENSVITFESSSKMYPADLNELIQNYEDGDGSKWAQFIRDYPEFEIFDEDGPSEVMTMPLLYNFFNPKCFLDANGQVLSFTYEYDGCFGTITFDGELATILGDDSLQLYAFKDCNNLKGITLPEGLTTIGNKAFNNANIFGVTIPASVTTIGESAFEGCSMQNITIPASVTTIGESAFANCPIQNITVQWTEAASIPTPGDNAFANIASPDTLHVPAKTRALYLNTAWSQIGTIDDPGYFTYIDENGEEQAASADLITDAYELVTWGEHDQTTWYAVPANANVDLFKGAICYGDVRLILADGATLNVGGYEFYDDDENFTPGIQVSAVDFFSASLTIYAQSTDPDKMGQLFATGIDNAAGIGSGQRQDGSNITINGGIITAHGGEGAAGIGGGQGRDGFNITINGGIVTANGGSSAAGIGGGYSGSGSNITINGGIVTANGGSSAAGIGGGSKGDGFGITINGGIVTANGGSSAAGIGGGYAGDVIGYAGRGYNITINGGTVTAIGGNRDHSFDAGAGIGNGVNAYWTAYNIYISDAYVLYAGANENNLQLITHSSATDLGSILTQQYVKIEGLATPYTLTVTDGQWGTVCLPYAATSFSGADFYKVNYYDENESKLYIEPVTTLEAGMPYIYEATDTSMLTINHDAITPMAYNAAGNENGFFGSFARQAFTSTNDFPHAYISEGAVIIAPAASQVIVPACRTYLYMNDVPRTEQPHSAPLRIMGEPCGPVTGDMQINAIVVRQNNAKQQSYQLASSPNIVFGDGDTITLNLGKEKEQQYILSESDTLTVLFGSAISNEVNAQSLEVAYPIYILNNGKLTVSGTMTNENAQNLVIEDGGQLRFDNGTVNAQVVKQIIGYGEGNGNWYLVSSPITDTDAPAGMIDETADNYDLYIFNQSSSDGLEWNNYKVQPFNIGGQNGYLYAHKNGTTLVFDGELAATATAKNLEFDNDAEFKGFNLIGNPYTCDAYIDRNFYRMNTNGTELIPASGAIHALEGVFVQATATGESVTFSKDAPTTQNGMCAMTLSQGTAAIDRAIVNFGKGGNLGKFMLDPAHTNIRLAKNGEEFAAVSTSSTSGEIPVSFKAARNGNYTITVNTENVEAEYLHLIDNLTGADVDLLATASTGSANYTFDAKTDDYASRFKLVFGVKDETSEASENFAYISNGEIIVSNEGRATLQIIDVLGRIVSSEEINGEARISTNGMTAGLYILNLNGMTQKIVVE